MSALTREDIAYETARRADETVAFKTSAKTRLAGAGQMLGVAALVLAIAAIGFLVAVASQKYATTDPAAPPAFTAVGP
ncbi:MAG TPA: hypothetical protein VEK35_06515 [Roseiarcus sp.]|nr:hypothetical protein [Roseiarcus sp.]